MLIPVGATLIVRDSVIETVKPYTRPKTAQREIQKLQRRFDLNLRKYERRGTTARNQLRREVKRTRTQVERELRQRRNRVSRLVRRNSNNIEAQVKGASRDFSRGAERLQTGVSDLAGDVRTTLS
ncbi:MAG: hypothetical protein NVSMB25_03410 [Thermoleophilaceae bacterium]